jgi:4-hydroxy-tetrahydrodipicolinate reductase
LKVIMVGTISLAIHGAAGRMGRRLIALAGQDASLAVGAAIDAPQSPHLGQDSGQLAGVAANGIVLSSEWPSGIEAAIDFSSPQGCESALAHCLQAKIPLVVATTGLTADQIARVKSAAANIPVCYAPNMSLAVNLTMKLVEQAARALRSVPSGVDVEIIERHHRFKEDSPSGTALKFGQIVAEQMGLTQHVHGREGQVGARTRHEVGYHAVRTGDDPGQHTIIFGMLGETIELRVAASNRDCYAAGALAAAKFLAKQPAGLYNMFDVLGLNDA